MPIKIHGNDYVTVAERVQEIHKLDHKFDITTEVLSDNPVVIKATVVMDRGTFTGISAANPDKAIEKMSPYEVAETSAVGRALGFAGFGSVDSIASADEMIKAGADEEVKDERKATSAQIGKIGVLANKELGYSNLLLSKITVKHYDKAKLPDLTVSEASDLIDKLQKEADKQDAEYKSGKEDIDPDEVAEALEIFDGKTDK